jgi:hypothetical protein
MGSILKIDPFLLHQAIPVEEFDYPLLCSALSGYSGVRQKIHALLKAGVIVRVKKGLYVFGPAYNFVPVCKEVLANLIYGPSCISLEYALAFHGLIPERVETITCVTPKRNKNFDTPLGKFTYHFIGMKEYPHGIQQVWIDQNHPVLMASPEKALCDYLNMNQIPELKTIESAKTFLEEDLRIDPEKWDLINQTELIKLNHFYRNKNITRITEALTETLVREGNLK